MRDRIERRPYHAGAAALAAGLALAVAPPSAVALCGFAAVACLLALRLARIALLVVVFVVAGSAFGHWRLDAIDRDAAPPGAALEGRALLLEPPKPSRFGSSAVVRMESGRFRGMRVLARTSGRARWPED